MRALSRRGFLLGGTAVVTVGAAAGYALVRDGTLPGRYQLDRILGACGTDPGVPDAVTGPVAATSFFSRYRRRSVRMLVMRPPGPAGPLPVAIVLHGAGADARAAVSFGYPQYLAAAVKAGLAPFAAVSVDGSSTYWHRRADGDDPLGMIVHEVLPRLSRCRYDIKKIGLIGWSMGGYGALLLASTLGPSRVAAVAASSPAVFGSYAAAVPGAFDGPADFAANDVASPARLGVLRQLPVRIDCGTDDPFAPRASSLRRELGDPPGAISGGCHDEGTMRRALPAELAFLGQRLSR